MITPRSAAEAECVRRGRPAFVAGCIALLRRGSVEDSLVVALGGAHGRMVLDETGPEQQYWLRVWAARGLLWVWGDAALPAIVEALADEHWRVREMAAKVVARRCLGDAFDGVASLAEDPVPRVASAAARAVRDLVAAGV